MDPEIVVIGGIPARKLPSAHTPLQRAKFIPPIPLGWDVAASRAGSNASRIRNLVAYRYRTARSEWFNIPAGLMDTYELPAQVRSRGLRELEAAGLIELRPQGLGRAFQVRVLRWR